jgi:hypothetical protein
MEWVTGTYFAVHFKSGMSQIQSLERSLRRKFKGIDSKRSSAMLLSELDERSITGQKKRKGKQYHGCALDSAIFQCLRADSEAELELHVRLLFAADSRRCEPKLRVVAR